MPLGWRWKISFSATPSVRSSSPLRPRTSTRLRSVTFCSACASTIDLSVRLLCQFVNAEVVLDPRPPSSAYGRKGTSEDVDDEEPKVKKKKTWNPDEDESAIDAGDYEKPGRKKKGREEDDGTVGGEDDEKYAKRTKNREDGSTKKKKGREKRAYEQDQSEEEPISAYNVRCLL